MAILFLKIREVHFRKKDIVRKCQSWESTQVCLLQSLICSYLSVTSPDLKQRLWLVVLPSQGTVGCLLLEPLRETHVQRAGVWPQIVLRRKHPSVSLQYTSLKFLQGVWLELVLLCVHDLRPASGQRGRNTLRFPGRPQMNNCSLSQNRSSCSASYRRNEVSGGAREAVYTDSFFVFLSSSDFCQCKSLPPAGREACELAGRILLPRNKTLVRSKPTEGLGYIPGFMIVF